MSFDYLSHGQYQVYNHEPSKCNCKLDVHLAGLGPYFPSQEHMESAHPQHNARHILGGTGGSLCSTVKVLEYRKQAP